MLPLLILAGITYLAKKAVDEFSEEVVCENAKSTARRFVEDHPDARELFRGGRGEDWLRDNLSELEIRRDVYGACAQAYRALKVSRQNPAPNYPISPIAPRKSSSIIPSLSRDQVLSMEDRMVKLAMDRFNSTVHDDLTSAARGIQRHYERLLGPGYAVTVTPFLGEKRRTK